jgi:hypothetical protein
MHAFSQTEQSRHRVESASIGLIRPKRISIAAPAIAMVAFVPSKGTRHDADERQKRNERSQNRLREFWYGKALEHARLDGFQDAGQTLCTGAQFSRRNRSETE